MKKVWTKAWGNFVFRNFRKAILLGAALAGAAQIGSQASDYPQTVTADAPLAYYRFNETNSDRPNINTNNGTLGAAGNATNLNVRSFVGAIVDEGRRAQFFDQTARAIVPFRPELNPDNTHPFTVEVWAYPASDQINGGQALINNRYAYSGVNRQGWVIFQRAPDSSYSAKPGFEGVGWNFRMYRGSGSSSGLDVTSQTPYQVGQWIHIVVVYDPVTPNDSSLKMYINGELANTATWSDPTNPGYVANTDDHGGEAVNGPAGLAFGAYNNTNVGADGQTAQANPYFGGIDEYAFYTNALSDATILAHYKNGTNSSRTISYADMVKADGAVEYLQFEELPPPSGRLINMGELRSDGDLTINNRVQLDAPSPLQGEWKDRSLGTHGRNGGGTRANMPFNTQNNPTEDTPLTVELWVRPQLDRINPGAAVINNRKAAGNRTGWVIFQRAPNDSYSGQSGYEGVGYNFRMYMGSGSSSGAQITTRVPYQVGEWQHLVFTWEPDLLSGGGNGTLTAYVNGTPIVPGEDPNTPNQSSGVYVANTDPTDDGTNPADLAIGSYNAASNWGQEFDGDIDEVAIYPNWALTADQVAAHYAAGTNSHPSTVGVAPSVVASGNDVTNYASLVFSAPYQGSLIAGIDPSVITQRMGPSTYLRFNDTPPYPTQNSGTTGWRADAVVQGGGTLYGPGATGGGFGNTNNGVAFDGTNVWVSISPSAPLNITGQITLEAWILPSATQGDRARIISHGPSLVSLYTADAVSDIADVLTSPEVFLQIDGTGANYTVGSSDGTNTFTATAPVAATDLTDNKWIHLAGTYDGSNWKLYRNGVLLATSAAATGALDVPNGDWAIGSTGEGWGDLFAGSIDEPAIYNKALSVAQIQAHYAAATGGSTGGDVTLSVTGSTDTTITLSWTGGTGKFLVQRKTDLNNPTWENVATTTNHSITIPKTSAMAFYRVQSDYTGPDIP
jgi:hypothetical protein